MAVRVDMMDGRLGALSGDDFAFEFFEGGEDERILVEYVLGAGCHGRCGCGLRGFHRGRCGRRRWWFADLGGGVDPRVQSGHA
jgi:hypothetical protein